MSTLMKSRRYEPEVLQMASQQVDHHILNDSKSPLLEEQLNCSVYATVSGMNDFDYPALPVGDGHTTSLDKQLTSVKRVPLPDELVEQFAHMQCNCVMGIFPEISRAWLAIDSDIYFWVYEDGSDVAYYDGIKEVILAVGLVTPKEGLFQEHIKYLLCVTTPINIYIFGISFSPQNPLLCGNTHGSIQLHPEPLFTTSTDNVYMTYICSTSNGRIFLAGKDGSLYEVVYQVQSSWFSKKCYKINHSASKMSFLVPGFLSYVFTADDAINQLAADNSRGILYCRTEKGDIKVYSLGKDMNQMHFVTGMSQAAISKQAQYVARTIDHCNFEKIIHLAPVPQSDSAHVHLVAVTGSGIRLYFSTSASSSSPYQQPSHLRLVHVRMPGGFAPSMSVERPSNVHTAFYRKGTSILVASASEDVDKLWCFSQDIFPFKVPLKETQSVVRIDGHTWCLSEIPDYTEPTNAPIHLFGEESPDPPSVVTEHVLPRRRFVLLSAQGSHMITTSRPLDQLRALLHASGNGESDSIAAYFQHYGAQQACATCLILICQTLESEGLLCELATQAFFRYGGEMKQSSNMTNITAAGTHPMSSFIVGSPIQGGSSKGSFLSTPHPQGLHSTIATPTPPNLLNSTSVQAVGMQVDQSASSLSSRQNGLLLYFSRVVRPIWALPLVCQGTTDIKTAHQLWSRLSSVELSWFIELLLKLQKFLDLHSDVSLSQTPVYMHSFTENTNNDEKRISEKRNLNAFYQLLTLTIEALQLWRVMCEHNFHGIIETLPPDAKEKLRSITFKEMFALTGRELSTHLINSLMSSYHHDNAAIESISEKLRVVCPSLYSADDALYTQANEVLMASSLLHNQVEKAKLAQESIIMYSKIPDLVDLQWTVNQLKTNDCFEEVVQLCLTIALKRDPSGIALHHYKCGNPRDDTEGLEIYSIRQNIYQYVIETLEWLSSHINSHPNSSTVPTKPGPPAVKEVTITQEAAKKYFHSMLTQCLKSGDELFHVVLYDWLIKTQQTDLLLEIKSAFLEQFLIATAAEKHPHNKPLLDLLWKLYERNSNFLSASKILLKLAEREGPTLTIHNRIEYLSRALMSIKSCGSMTTSAADGEFLREIEEKLDVAQVQLKIFDQLSQKKMMSAEKDDALIQLNSKLLDISTLYGDFAEKFSLHECKLLVIHCAGHSDAALIEKIWKEIIDKTFDDNKSLSSESRMQAISQHLVHCGKSYYQHMQYFPIGFLIYYLECKNCEHDFGYTWVYNILQNIGVTFTSTFNHYVSLYQAKDKVWQRLGKSFHLLAVLAEVFNNFLIHPTQTTSERVTLTRSLFEITTSFLVELEAMNTYDANVRDLLARFKSIQAKLKRLL